MAVAMTLMWTVLVVIVSTSTLRVGEFWHAVSPLQTLIKLIILE